MSAMVLVAVELWVASLGNGVSVLLEKSTVEQDIAIGYASITYVRVCDSSLMALLPSMMFLPCHMCIRSVNKSSSRHRHCHLSQAILSIDIFE